ncbi:Ppx/GppA phosphatase family protein [Sphingomonas carotinifaciens]|uniref:Exopolyphosphatase / guanosine-5'-triphosphate,3'-diphosphate pyrophosphatase n=1 Tax=Sphingomonas carotinifaciens TaxID=1166323 RepID=A0A1G7N9G0_9SPHN|nr:MULTISPECIES: Ppx/GppA phosphatase family protein [Sphingomonas]MBB4087159.1 exopolyphosphatase/guanosine-5'-triphosphate,3'-diphosphate pyrophosphatase [Sphingomonas carotinifaciens]MWC43155.1 Ppx/GppA family phosphatase [Sphingomonas carotinifaciens]SDF70688.1 exopolyphosphatase / guanosine-5'-triphosphate,3'-diphosphate pyrophosphatase [Sphingomonas carotinifaciens]
MGDVSARRPYRQAKPPARSAPTRPARGRWSDAQAFAALDLGTNNCRLLIARPQGGGFAVVDAFSRIVRLGEGLATSGQLSDAAIERTIAALRVCADKLKRRNVTLARSVATEACRRASNGPAFIARALEETGIHLDIISAEEEARLAVLGCHALIEPGEDPALVFDIGGGSTELVLVDTRSPVPKVLDWHSAPWGVVSLTESAGGGEGEEGRLAAYARMRGLVADSFAGFASRLPRNLRNPRLLGTSGTVTTLGSVHLGLSQYDRAAVDGLIVPAAAMRTISAQLSRQSLGQRAKVPCIGTERADLVVAGCAILETIMDLWPAERLGIADRGIREGILRRLMGSPPPQSARA